MNLDEIEDLIVNPENPNSDWFLNCELRSWEFN